MASATLLNLGSAHTFSTSTFIDVKAAESNVCFQASGDPSLDDFGLSILVNATAAALSPAQRASTSLQLAADAAIPSTWEWDDLSFGYGALPGPAILNGNTFEVLVSPGAHAGAPLIAATADARDAGIVTVASGRSNTAATGSAKPPPPELGYGIDSTGSIELQVCH